MRYRDAWVNRHWRIIDGEYELDHTMDYFDFELAVEDVAFTRHHVTSERLMNGHAVRIDLEHQAREYQADIMAADRDTAHLAAWHRGNQL